MNEKTFCVNVQDDVACCCGGAMPKQKTIGKYGISFIVCRQKMSGEGGDEISKISWRQNQLFGWSKRLFISASAVVCQSHLLLPLSKLIHEALEKDYYRHPDKLRLDFYA